MLLRGTPKASLYSQNETYFQYSEVLRCQAEPLPAVSLCSLLGTAQNVKAFPQKLL